MIIVLANVLVLFAIPFMVARKEPGLRFVFWSALLLRLICGVVIGLVYLYYYRHGDTIDYFRQAEQLSAIARGSFSEYIEFMFSSQIEGQGVEGLGGQPRALFFSKWVSVTALLTHNNYWLSSFYFSLISFLGSWFLSRELVTTMPQYRWQIFGALLFLPSVVVWTSGVIKESLALAALFFIVSVFLRVWRSDKVTPSQWVVLALALWILWGLKYYYFAVLMPVLLTELAVRRINRRFQLRPLPYILVWLTVLIVPVALVMTSHPNFYPSRFLEVIVSNHDLFVSMSQPEDLIHYNDLAPDARILQNVPLALWSGFFRPMLWEISNPMQLMAALENLFIAALVASFILSNVPPRGFSSLWFAAIVYSIVLCIFLALSTPNLGTLSRYKAAFLPFLVLAVACENVVVSKVLSIAERRLRDLV